MPGKLFVGTAGWTIPRMAAHHCPGEGTHLQRYAHILPCAEINSSFHRPHSVSTYAKWAASTPADFRFAVKMPRTITHDRRLLRVRRLLEAFLVETSGLKRKRGPLLVQLPPSFAFDKRLADRFFTLLRSLYAGPVACEPRHPTWFEPAANALLIRHEVVRVAADPAPVPGADVPGGWEHWVYYRLHGSPRMYWSAYEDDYLKRLSDLLRARPRPVDAWCVFDNTAGGAALGNACTLRDLLAS